MFVFIILLIDLFTNLVRYLHNEVPISTILTITWFFIPKSISYALPISLLFAAAYTLGELYAKNELACVFSTGIPYWRFCVPLVVLGFLVSVFSFFFDDVFVIPTLRIKNDLSRRALHQHVTESDTDIVIISRYGRLIYSVDFFDDERQILNGISIVYMDDEGGFISQVRAPSAEWDETHWVFRNAVIYQYEGDNVRITPLPFTTEFREHPDIFRRRAVIVQELPVREARLLVHDLRSVGLPFYHAQANYYHRFSFATTSFIVMILSVSMGGRFRKNILLMSLFTSLAIAVVFYITEMLSMTLAGLNYIHPFVGAWFPVLLFIFIGLFLLRSAKT
jgi:lipopolysaccharide export system permease protein